MRSNTRKRHPLPYKTAAFHAGSKRHQIRAPQQLAFAHNVLWSMASVAELAQVLIRSVHLDLFPEQYADVFGMGNASSTLNSNVLGTWQFVMKTKFIKIGQLKEAIANNEVLELFCSTVFKLAFRGDAPVYATRLLKDLETIRFAPVPLVQGPLPLSQYLKDMQNEARDAMDAMDALNHPWADFVACMGKLRECKAEARRLHDLGYHEGGIAQRVLQDIQEYLKD